MGYEDAMPVSESRGPDRVEVIRTLMRTRGLRRYLEIGVFNGHVFFRVRSRHKVAVDPCFRFGAVRRLGKAVLNPYNLFNRYFEKTSDAFFEEDAPAVLAGGVDLALVDGLHEYRQVLRDVDNVLRHLRPGGVILLHDCNPPSAEAAVPLDRRGPGRWNGDVWKAIVHLRSLRDDLDVFVLDADEGLGFVTRGRPRSRLDLTASRIGELGYDDLARHRQAWLGLEPASSFHERFGQAAGARD
jgi:SAM-dependent methyltransferase